MKNIMAILVIVFLGGHLGAVTLGPDKHFTLFYFFTFTNLQKCLIHGPAVRNLSAPNKANRKWKPK